MSTRITSGDKPLAREAPYAFLSSLFREHKELRARILEDGQRLGCRVYVDEKDFPNRDMENQDDLAVADHLISQIREAKIFICVLGGPRHGSPVKIGGHASAVSFFEIELFQAALLKKPIHLFVIEGFSPQPALASLFNILDFALPQWSIQRYLSERQVREGICKLLRSRTRTRTAPTSLIPRRRSALRRLVECLYFARARRNTNDAGGGILFLNGRISDAGDVPDEHLIRTTLQAAGEQPNEERRLARLWIALRELMKSGPNGFHEEQALEYWNLALGHWASAAAKRANAGLEVATAFAVISSK